MKKLIDILIYPFLKRKYVILDVHSQKYAGVGVWVYAIEAAFKKKLPDAILAITELRQYSPGGEYVIVYIH